MESQEKCPKRPPIDKTTVGRIIEWFNKTKDFKTVLRNVLTFKKLAFQQSTLVTPWDGLNL